MLTVELHYVEILSVRLRAVGLATVAYGSLFGTLQKGAAAACNRLSHSGGISVGYESDNMPRTPTERVAWNKFALVALRYKS